MFSNNRLAIPDAFGPVPAQGESDRCCVCGDEHKDYRAAVATGMHSLIASYSFDNHDRLTSKYAVPEMVIASTPVALGQRLCHALDIPAD